jgi:acetyl esterase/lipase
LPTWIIVGDEDSLGTVQNARTMAQALRDAGTSPAQTEYRAVPHNSWDRAYNDPAVIEWMLSKSRKMP